MADVVRLLQSAPEESQLAALSEVLRTTSADRAEMLEAFARANNEGVARAGLEALAQVAPERARSVASRQVRSKRMMIRRSAVEVLARFESPSLEEGLKKLTFDREPHVVAESIRRLGEFDNSVVTARAGRLLSHPSIAVQGAAAEALSRQTSGERVEYLRQAIEHQDPGVRRAAIGGLRRHPVAESEELILTRLGDAVEDVEASAIDALGDVGTERSLPHLIAVARNNPTLASLAKRNLRAIYRRLGANC